MEIPFKDPKHKRLFDAVHRRWRLSLDKSATRHAKYSELEDQFVAYIPEKDADAKRRVLRDSHGEPQYTTIVVPYSYAQLLAAHTYWTSVFLARNPVFQFQGRHGETQQSVEALEAIMDYQLNVGEALVVLFIWLMDVGKYGAGLLGCYWEENYANVMQEVEEPVTFLGVPVLGKTKKVRRTTQVPGYVGNKLYNIRPQDFFHDPRVPLSGFQTGEFCGRYTEVGWNTIIRRKQAGLYFNIEELKATKQNPNIRVPGSQRVVLPDNWDTVGSGGSDISKSHADRLESVQIIEMVIELVPNEWGLGPEESPQKWVFTTGNDQVLIGLQPLGQLHDRFPYSLLEFETEGYGMFKRSMLEVAKPLNDVLSWLFNSHFYNVRTILNGQFAVDPSRIVMKDILDPQPGRMWRLAPSAYGTDPRLAVHQFNSTDVTTNHIRDAGFVMQIMQYLTGANENIMGAVNSGGRKTATEVRSSNTFGVNRLKTNTEYFSAMGFAPLAQMMVQNTQQNLDIVRKYRAAGSLMDDAAKLIAVDPEAITGFYDFVPVDGVLPVDKFALATMWERLMGGMGRFPSLMMQYDVGRIFGYIAQLGGVKNLNQFKLQVQPDAQTLAQAQQGNIIPLRGQDGRAGQGARASQGTATGVQGAAQLPGMGPAG